MALVGFPRIELGVRWLAAVVVSVLWTTNSIVVVVARFTGHIARLHDPGRDRQLGTTTRGVAV
jgi:hypothetical protein